MFRLKSGNIEDFMKEISRDIDVISSKDQSESFDIYKNNSSPSVSQKNSITNTMKSEKIIVNSSDQSETAKIFANEFSSEEGKFINLKSNFFIEIGKIEVEVEEVKEVELIEETSKKSILIS